MQQKMESFFGNSFADVRVHVGSQAPSIGARAFAHGSNLYFAPGHYNPGTRRGQQLLGHELTHVVQQREGRVKNPFGSGVAVVQDRSMEGEADQMGLRAASHNESVPAKTVPSAPRNMGTKVVSPFSSATGLRAQAIQRTPEESDSLQNLGRIWNKIAEQPAESNDKRNFFSVYAKEIHEKLGFSLYTVWHKHDLYVGGGKNKNYVNIVKALQGGDAGKAMADLYVMWADGPTTIDQLPNELQELILIVHIAEVGRMYLDAPDKMLDFMNAVAEESTKDGRVKLWKEFQQRNVFAYTSKNDPDYNPDVEMSD